MSQATRHCGKPVVVAERFISLTLSMDGIVLYMRKADMHDVRKSRKSGDGWSLPEPFMNPTYGVYDYMPTPSGNAYVGSNPNPDARSMSLDSTVTFTSRPMSPIRSSARKRPKPLFAAEGPLSRLNAHIAEQELNLLQYQSGSQI